MATLKFRSGSTDWQSVPAIQGEPGVTPNITVQATTLAAGSAATVTKTGTNENPVLTFGIPKGEAGAGKVQSVNGKTPDASGNITIDLSTYATKTELNSVSSTASSAKTNADKRVLISGARGQLAGYETPNVTANAVTINASSNDTTQVTGAVAVTVTDGAEGTSWTKSVSLTNASATITLGGSWIWSGGEIPTVSENAILVLHWCNDVGVANLIEGAHLIRTYTGTLYGYMSGASIYRDGVNIGTLSYDTTQTVSLAIGDEICYDASPATYTINSMNGITLVEESGSLVVTSISNGFQAEFVVHPM